MTTKSSEIRAMAAAGSTRTEIAKELGIRYQHVRKVLLDSGFEGGLQRKTDGAVRKDRPARQMPKAAVDVSPGILLDAGFENAGQWRLHGEGLRFVGKLPSAPGVYAFVAGGRIVYVGVTNRRLDNRIDGYRRGYEKQRTNVRLKAKLIETLNAGIEVEVLFARPVRSEWNGLPVVTALGLEAGLIQMLRPAWNMVGTGFGAEQLD